MSEELAVVVPEQTGAVVDTNAQPAEPQEPTVEDLAREKGWRPKEEYSGDAGRWKSAEVFLALDEPIQKIEALAKELKEQKKANQMLLQHHQQVKESEFKRAYEFLKSQKKQAFERGDVDRILELDEQLDLVKETQRQQTVIKQQAAVQEKSQELHPDFKRWVGNNAWYESDSTMRETADALGLTHAQKNQNKTPQEVLEFVSSQIKRMYPEKFQNPKRLQGSGVETPTSSKQKADSIELTEEERTVMNSFVRQGIMSKEDYIKDLKAIRGIK